MSKWFTGLFDDNDQLLLVRRLVRPRHENITRAASKAQALGALCFGLGADAVDVIEAPIKAANAGPVACAGNVFAGNFKICARARR